MVMMYQTMVLAFIALIAPVFAKSAGYELRRKPFECIGVSGLFFLLSVAFGLLPLTQVAGLVALWNCTGDYLLLHRMDFHDSRSYLGLGGRSFDLRGIRGGRT